MRAYDSTARFSPYVEDRFRLGLEPDDTGAAEQNGPPPQDAMNEAGAMPLPPGESLRALPPPDVAVPPPQPPPAPAEPPTLAVTPPEAAVPIELAPPAPAEASPAAAAPPPAPSFTGEASVDPAWLQQREAAFQAIRADHEAARAAAQANVGGPGWQPAATYSDESGQQQSASGRAMTFVADPNGQPQVVSYDESGPVYGPPPGTFYEFDDAAFAAHYQAQAGTPLQTLAGLYGTDVPTLFAQHPELWTLATSDHAINAGPPPAGQAMGDPGQLGMVDLYLSDPQVQSLVQAFGGEAAPPTSAIAQEQVRIYGAARYAQMTRFSHAMQSVRDQYAQAMGDAQRNGGPGWREQPRTLMVSDESGPSRPMVITDESGAPLMTRVFDPDAFTAWYEAQPGLANQAFKDFYGASHTTWGSDESGQQAAADLHFDNPNWSMAGAGGPMWRQDLVGIDPNSPPRLNDDSAIGFDLEAGWSTPQSNIHHSRDWFDTLVQIVIVGGVSYLSAGTLGPAVAGAMGLTTGVGVGATATLTLAGTMVSAAVAGAAGAVASGALNGNLSFKGVLQGALAGGLSAGLLSEYGAAVSKTYGAVGTVALRTTVQGGIQALLGGDFKDGALSGFASGLADVTAQSLGDSIKAAVDNGTMDAAQATAARQFTRVLGSAIRIAGNPNDPGQGFAAAYLDSVLNETDPAGLRNNPDVPKPYVPEAPPPAPEPATPSEPAQPPSPDAPVDVAPPAPEASEPPQPPPAVPAPSDAPPADGELTPGPFAPAPDPSGAFVPPAFDDEGNLMPGVVDLDASPEEQTAQLTDYLQRQGLDADTASQVANEALSGLPDVMPRILEAINDPRTASQRLVTDTSQDQAVADVNAELGIDPEADPNLVPAGWLGDAADSASKYVSRVVDRVGGPLKDTLNRAMDAITIGRLEEAQQAIASYLDGVAARGGLSEAEIMALGVLYAANATLFPTTILDVIPGGGKALGKAADLLRAGGTARELAALTRQESRAMADAERAVKIDTAGIEAKARAEGREVIRETRGVRSDWNDALNGPLKSNAVYILDNGHSYFTDQAGRVVRAEASLDLQTVDRNSYQQVMAGQIGGEGYDGGHLIASLFGGAGEKINLVPQLSSVNRGEFREMEKSWADAIRNKKTVKVEVTPVYEAGGAVPQELYARWWIDDVPYEKSFLNVQGG